MSIEYIEAWTAQDPNNEEGICAALVGDVFYPLVSANSHNKKRMDELAREVMRKTGQKLTLKRFEFKATVKTMEMAKEFND